MARSQSDTAASGSRGSFVEADGQAGGGDEGRGDQPGAPEGHMVGWVRSNGGINGCTGNQLAGIRSKMFVMAQAPRGSRMPAHMMRT